MPFYSDPAQLSSPAAWGLGADSFTLKAFTRNLGMISRSDQQRLARSRVAIAGMGGVGGIHLITLARSGIGAFNIADFDRFEPANFNRQYGSRVESLGREKTAVMRHDALQINPFLDIRVFEDGVNAKNVDAFLDGADVFLDGLDFFAPAARRLVFGRARERKIPAVTAGPIGFGTSAVVFHPDGMSFDDYFDLRDGQSDLQQMLRFYAGIVPQGWFRRYTLPQWGVNLQSKSAPSLSIGCLMASAVAGTEVLRLLLDRGGKRAAPCYFQMDAYTHQMKEGVLRWGNRGPIQRLKLALGQRQMDRRRSLFRSRTIAPAWSGSGPIPDPVRDYLLEAGLQAPSGDNLQPWSFQVKENAIDLKVEKVDHSLFNAEERASILSLGCVAENIRIAATEYGLDTSVGISSDPAKAPNRLTFESTQREMDPLTDVVWERNTNRRLQEPRAIPSYALEEMGLSAQHRGARLSWVTDRDGIEALSDVAYWSDRARVVIRECHETLCEAFRPNAREAKRRGDGFSYGNLLARFDQRLFLKLTRPWGVMNLFNHLGMGKAIANLAKSSVRASGGIGVMRVPSGSLQEYFQGGMAFERVWLTATLHGLALQPMASLPFLWAIWKNSGESVFPESARPHIARAMKGVRSVFKDVDFDREGFLMMFRVGYAANIPEGTFRRPLKSFVRT